MGHHLNAGSPPSQSAKKQAENCGCRFFGEKEGFWLVLSREAKRKTTSRNKHPSRGSMLGAETPVGLDSGSSVCDSYRKNANKGPSAD